MLEIDIPTIEYIISFLRITMNLDPNFTAQLFLIKSKSFVIPTYIIIVGIYIFIVDLFHEGVLNFRGLTALQIRNL